MAERGSCPCMVIWESELQAMAGEAALAGEIETGGDLHGQWTRGGQPVVHLAGGPGRHAIHEVAHFSQDLEYCRRMNELLGGSYGLQWLGTHHSHHRMQLTRPSPGDTEQVRSLTRRNGLDRWYEIILTHEPGGPSAPVRGTERAMLSGARSLPRIRVNAFAYTEPQRGEMVRARIRILPGVSPFRLALLSANRFSDAGAGHGAPWLPMECIVLDRHQDEGLLLSGHRIPASLTEQLEHLPREAQSDLKITVDEDLFIVTLALPDGRTAYVALRRHHPHAVVAARVSSAGGTRDVTDTILCDGNDIGLEGAYARLACVSAQRPWKMSRSTQGLLRVGARWLRTTHQQGTPQADRPRPTSGEEKP